MAIGLLLGVVFIVVAEWFFQALEVRPTQYAAMADYIVQDPDDQALRRLVSTALQDNKITSREYKPIVHHILDREGIYEQRLNIDKSKAEAKELVRRSLET